MTDDWDPIVDTLKFYPESLIGISENSIDFRVEHPKLPLAFSLKA